MTERQQAIIDLLELPDPPTIKRGYVLKQPGRADRRMTFRPQVHQGFWAYRDLERWPLLSDCQQPRLGDEARSPIPRVRR